MKKIIYVIILLFISISFLPAQEAMRVTAGGDVLVSSSSILPKIYEVTGETSWTPPVNGLSYTMTTVKVDASASDVTISLPTVSSENTGMIVYVTMKTAGNAILFSGTGLSYQSDLKIEGDVGGFAQFQSDGSGTWDLIGYSDAGSTSNGRWRKEVDGTLGQWGSDSSSGSGWVTHTYPLSFGGSISDISSSITTISDGTQIQRRELEMRTGGSYALSSFQWATTYAGGTSIKWHAIGRWRP